MIMSFTNLGSKLFKYLLVIQLVISHSLFYYVELFRDAADKPILECFYSIVFVLILVF